MGYATNMGSRLVLVRSCAGFGFCLVTSLHHWFLSLYLVLSLCSDWQRAFSSVFALPSALGLSHAPSTPGRLLFSFLCTLLFTLTYSLFSFHFSFHSYLLLGAGKPGNGIRGEESSAVLDLPQE